MPYYQSGELAEYSSGTDLYDRSLTVHGIKIVAGAEVSGNNAVPDAWVYKTARVIQLLLDPKGQGIDRVAQDNAHKNITGRKRHVPRRFANCSKDALRQWRQLRIKPIAYTGAVDRFRCAQRQPC